jgi:choline monooxygenase
MSSFTIDSNISKAKTLNKEFYTDIKYFLEAKEKIFSPTWQFAAHADVIKESGHCYPFTLLENYLDEPLVLTKEGDRIYCLSNVCTHRGAIVVDGPCKISNLRCRYHGRLFNLSGSFRSMPEFREVKNFPSKDDDLRSLPVFKWGQWLFTSLDMNGQAGKYFQDMINRIDWLPLDDFTFRPELSHDYIVNAHWALYCENFLEGFHIPFVHAGLNAVIDFGNYTTELFEYSNLQVGMAKSDKDAFNLPQRSPDYGKKIAAYYFFVFPNMMFNFYPWGLSINLVQPLSIEQSKVCFLTYVWDESKLNTGAGSDLNMVEKEDEEIVEAVQKGIRSRFYTQGRYSVVREQGIHHFHRIIADFMK